jgi:Zn finger protein HypA/HybF involved in hydrogenase expression
MTKEQMYQDLLSVDTSKLGWISKLSKKWHMSHTCATKKVCKYFPEIIENSYKRKSKKKYCPKCNSYFHKSFFNKHKCKNYLEKYRRSRRKLHTRRSLIVDKDILEKSVSKAESFNQVIIDLKQQNISISFKRLFKLIKFYELSTKHFLGKSSLKARKKLEKEEFILECLTNNSKHAAYNIKSKILHFEILEYICNSCGQNSEWNNKKLVLHLHHKNGNDNDNRLDNLEFLCPNCHSQTETYCRSKSKKLK